MTQAAATPAHGPRAARWWPRADASDWTHALQLGTAVLLAFGLSALLRLPEGFWAVMSALIVLRPTVGSTLGAGWDRVRGTAAGTLIGLAGVWLHHLPGFGGSTTSLAIVALLAATGALLPALRSAPITALIVLGSSGIGDHSALQVAALRAIEIGIGVATGALLSLTSLWQSTARRFDAACAGVLRQMAAQLRSAQNATPPEREATNEALRTALRALAIQAVGAAREARLIARVRRRPLTADPVRRARIAARTLHDVTLFTRVPARQPEGAAVPDARALGAALAQALETAAEHLDAQRELPPEALRAMVRSAAEAAPGVPWVQPLARLVAEDLVLIARP